MADKTIGQLTAAGTLTGAELVEVEQGGNSRQTTVDLVGDRLPKRSKEWVGQRSTVKTVSIVSGEVAWNLADGNVHFLDGADANFLLKLPADIATHVGQSGVFIVKQNGAGGFDMTVASGITPLNSDTLFEIAQAAGAITVIPYIVISATQIGISGAGFGVKL